MPTVRERNKSVVTSLTLQAPTPAQGARLDAIRKAAQAFAKVVVKNTEDGHESSLAQDAIVEATQRAVRSVLFELPEPDETTVAPVKKTVTKRKLVAPAKKTGVKRATKRAAGDGY
jgi:hypothetical protein